MDVFHGYDHVPPGARGASVAIGNFDGVHKGHQALIARARQEAVPLAALTGAILFEPHPREFFQPSRPLFTLTPLPQKLRLLERYGVDLAFVLPFAHELAQMSAEAFVERVLVAGLGVRHVVIGYDFLFGKSRAGNAQQMAELGRAMGFGVSIVPPVGSGGEVYSSSAVRAELAQGDVEGAAQMLGHRWKVEGVVQGGARRGTGLGYPTANIALGKGAALAHGIYAVHVEFEGTRYQAAAYLGTRPTFDDGSPVLEVFLFDFDGDLYGRRIEVEFVDFLRGDRKFDSLEALKAQMDIDCARAREVLTADAERSAPVGRNGQ
ncbi:MAG TPA: bifunctional riboflavin kinase/FAD synthetase [Hyphomicrobiaceae bacterium]|nr:bifunctional riboflavin kinase/FAD synthetase [Hyphomicrobiaceae bacterium]